MKLDWFIYISPRKDTPMKESHQSFRAKQNGKEFRVNIHKRAYLNPEKFPGDPPTHCYLSYIYVHVHAIKEGSMVVAIFRHYWSPLEKEFYKNI